MGFVIQYVANYAPWIYAICGLVAIYHIHKIWQVRVERRQAVFSLEREKAVRDTYNIFAIALLLVLVMGFTYFVSNTLAIAVDPIVEEARNPDPGVPFVATPTNTPLPATPTPTVTPTLPPETVAAMTLEAQTTATAEAEAEAEDDNGDDDEEATPTPAPPTAAPAPIVSAPSCPDPRAVLLQPGSNQVVSGQVNIVGTATHQAFQYYKVESAPGANASNGFSYLGGGNTAVENGILAALDTNALGNGPWTLRLIVVDQTGNFPPPCQVTFNVQN
jgi:hypothetical protein